MDEEISLDACVAGSPEHCARLAACETHVSAVDDALHAVSKALRGVAEAQRAAEARAQDLAEALHALADVHAGRVRPGKHGRHDQKMSEPPVTELTVFDDDTGDSVCSVSISPCTSPLSEPQYLQSPLADPEGCLNSNAHGNQAGSAPGTHIAGPQYSPGAAAVSQPYVSTNSNSSTATPAVLYSGAPHAAGPATANTVSQSSAPESGRAAGAPNGLSRPARDVSAAIRSVADAFRAEAVRRRLALDGLAADVGSFGREPSAVEDVRAARRAWERADAAYVSAAARALSGKGDAPAQLGEARAAAARAHGLAVNAALRASALRVASCGEAVMDVLVSMAQDDAEAAARIRRSSAGALCLSARDALLPPREDACPPTKAGFMYKRSRSSVRHAWSRRFFVLRESTLSYAGHGGRSVSIALGGAAVRRLDLPERAHCVEVATSARTYTLQAEGGGPDADAWAEALLRASLPGPSRQPVSIAVPSAPLTSSELAAIAAVPGNAACADCGAGQPDWASVSFGALVCIRCAGLHRALGVHVTRVRALRMDLWRADHAALLLALGNAAAAAVFGHAPAHGSRDEAVRLRFASRAFLRPLGSADMRAAIIDGDAASVLRVLAHSPGAASARLAGPELPSDVPLSLAIATGRSAIAALLLLWGADAAAADSAARTPLHHLAAVRGLDVAAFASSVEAALRASARQPDVLAAAIQAARANGSTALVSLIEVRIASSPSSVSPVSAGVSPVYSSSAGASTPADLSYSAPGQTQGQALVPPLVGGAQRIQGADGAASAERPSTPLSSAVEDACSDRTASPASLSTDAEPPAAELGALRLSSQLPRDASVDSFGAYAVSVALHSATALLSPSGSADLADRSGSATDDSPGVFPGASRPAHD